MCPLFRGNPRQWIAFQYDALGRLTSRRDPVAPADSFQYLNHGRVVIAKNTIETDTLKAGTAGADTTSTVLAAGPWFRRVWTKAQGALGDTLTLSSSATALTFLARRRYWSATTGALDSILIGTNKVRFTVDSELLPDSTIYPAYTRYRLRTSTHEDYKSVYSTSALDSVFSRTYSFDSLGRITSEGHINGYQSGWTWDLRGYAYNASGPLRWYQRATTTNRTCEPDYGCRLASTVPYQTYGYPHYDAALNLLTRVDSTHGNAKDSATFAVGDRVLSWLGASYTYDADGNRATRTVGSTVTHYSWDASGRLLQVKTGSDSVTYAYNALGELARRSTQGDVDRWFVWEAGQLLEELDGTGQHRVNAFAYLPGTDAPLARITGDAASTVEFVQQDGRGDVIGMTYGSSVTQHSLYGPWGNLEWQGGDSLAQTRLGWKGLVWEGGAAQLYYVRSRWYDPASRSFLSEDPLGLSGGRNTYAYGDNDPVNGSDPSGLSMFMCHPRDVWVPSYGYYGSDGYDIIAGHWKTDGVECAMLGSGYGENGAESGSAWGADDSGRHGGGGGVGSTPHNRSPSPGASPVTTSFRQCVENAFRTGSQLVLAAAASANLGNGLRAFGTHLAKAGWADLKTVQPFLNYAKKTRWTEAIPGASEAAREAGSMIARGEAIEAFGPYLVVGAAGLTIGYALGASGACALDRNYYSQ